MTATVTEAPATSSNPEITPRRTFRSRLLGIYAFFAFAWLFAPLFVIVVFSFNKFYRFKEIKVVIVAEMLTNRFAHPLWHLTTISNSVICNNFSYGDRLRGMTPKVKGATPDPLTPGINYRLIVETEKGGATHDFSTTARP